MRTFTAFGVGLGLGSAILWAPDAVDTDHYMVPWLVDSQRMQRKKNHAAGMEMERQPLVSGHMSLRS